MLPVSSRAIFQHTQATHMQIPAARMEKGGRRGPVCLSSLELTSVLSHLTQTTSAYQKMPTCCLYMSNGRCVRCSCVREGRACTDSWPSRQNPSRSANLEIYIQNEYHITIPSNLMTISNLHDWWDKTYNMNY